MQELAELSDDDRDLALARFQMLRPHLEHDVALRVVAEQAEIPFRTAQRWVARYRSCGLTALARKPRLDRGARRVVSGKLKAAIEGLALFRDGYGLFIPHARMSTRQIQMVRCTLAQVRCDLPAIHLHHRTGAIEHRDHDGAIEVLMAALSQHPQRLQPATHLRAGGGSASQVERLCLWASSLIQAYKLESRSCD